MFRKLRKWYFKIYHLFKLLGIFILIFGLKEKVYAETNTYYIKDGEIKTEYEYKRISGNEGSGNITEKYNNSNFVYATSATWSQYNLNLNNLVVNNGDIIYITFKKEKAWTGQYSQYGGGAIALTNNNTTEYKYFIFAREATELTTYNYTIQNDNTGIEIMIGNLAYSNSFEEYGISISDLWVKCVDCEEPITQDDSIYGNFIELYTNKIEYLANGFTNNPYLLTMIGIIFAWVVLELFLKILHLRGGYKK